jgi:ubiquinone/menaquinone biosynthesis C-methylase UbiE
MNEWNKKRDVMERYDLTAHIYDKRYAEEQTAKIEAALKSMNVEKRSLVLDAGCGTGLLFDYVANKAETLVGLDTSRKVLFQAKRRTKRSLNAQLICADAENMPLRKDVFDYIFAITLIQNTPDPVKALNEIRRVAKGQASVIVTGLKRKFTLETFRKLLLEADLRVIALKDESLKCHVAVCRFHRQDTQSLKPNYI